LSICKTSPGFQTGFTSIKHWGRRNTISFFGSPWHKKGMI
jgi:hypothetical protein